MGSRCWQITHPDPNEPLIACRNPALATERARKRTDLLTATETLLAPSLRTIDLQLRPIHHRLEDRVRAHIQFPGTDTGFDQLTTATDTQRGAFDLIGTAIPTTLK